jgi:hypothetical protein
MVYVSTPLETNDESSHTFRVDTKIPWQNHLQAERGQRDDTAATGIATPNQTRNGPEFSIKAHVGC